ncbi:MAG: CRISPR system precrRNA processing endoribonuclease RAMP protein Cas6 [Candidatus Competibacteraceae bacterium]|nr:CRISPR system precrRNA processing endoribonuclease RAMP protein Cas6 [Candidatus Competibacteraceae bacterium]MCB1813237.1 CRISPR system precrRNA processing endoribonuclease RAMP protein Cas6 [Candidatus Competibacteraceae bacterium]
MCSQPQLMLARFSLSFRNEKSLRLPDYAGSAWRGVFGHALKKLACVTREPQCANCMLYRTCLYPYIFETPVDPALGVMRKYPHAPHPFVLAPGPQRGVLPPGQDIHLGLTLFGRGLAQLPYVIYALNQAGQRGLTKARIPLALQTVQQQDANGTWQTIYTPQAELTPLTGVLPAMPECPPGSVRISVHSPLRLRVDNELVGPDKLCFAMLFSALLRRLSMLSVFHGDQALETDFAALTQAAQNISILRSALHWQDQTRYSSRQQTTLPLGGIKGWLELDGAQLQPFWPYLWLGQWTHVGKGASMGLGRYQITADKLAGPDFLPATFNTAQELSSIGSVSCE